MKSVFYVLMLLSTFYTTAFSQDTISYTIRFPNAVHHEAEVSVKVSNVSTEELTAIMSKSSPGRYAIHNFAKNVYAVQAYGKDSSSLPIQKSTPDSWNISEVSGEAALSYTIYGNHADGTYLGIDADFANLNMPATLMWIEGMDNLPVKVKFDIPDSSSWKIATQLPLLDSAGKTYFAPNLQYLMDSPCILSDFTMKEFQAGDGITIRMAIMTQASDDEMERFMQMTKAAALEQKAVFGELPSFNDSTYTFLCSFGPGFYGDGMEHRNSTMVTSGKVLSGNEDQLIGTISHEFFHVWNIERIRPASLEPFDFTRANMSGELWFGEGFTSYYGDLALCRAGIIPKDKYIGTLSGKINYLENAPGWKYKSPVAMSKMAPFTDAATSIDENNYANTFISYYVYGELMALALDLSLRSEFKAVTLDDLMKAMWDEFGKKEIPYSNNDIQNVLSEVCGDEKFASAFFDKYIYGNELPDFESLFDKIGYKKISKRPGKPSLGYVRLKFDGDTATVQSQPLVGSALYEAGVTREDIILSIDDQPVTSYPELNFIIGTRKIDDEVAITFSHRGKLKKSNMKLKADNQLVFVPKEKFSIQPVPEEVSRKEVWLKSKVNK